MPLISIKKPVVRKRNIVLRWLLMALVVCLIAGVTGWRIQARSSHNRTIADNVRLIAQVPSNETPVISTIADKSKINQAFLSEAENGDKIVIYPKARKAVLYRPSTKRIVAIAPVADTPPQIFLRNGTKQTNLDPVVTKLQQAPEEYRLLSRDNAAKSYEQTMVIDLTGLRETEAKQLAQALGGQVGSLPEGESRPDGELLVIIGDDQFN
jgi:hypothetical protein